jgi:hypothetical protein
MKIDFSTDGMEILESFFSEENSSEDNITETIYLGQAQNFMETFQKDNSLNQIKILLPTSLSGTQKGGGKKDRRVKEENTPPSEANTG